MTDAPTPPPRTLASHPAATIIKALVIGESGTGKSGMLASLAAAGYNLWVLDYDNGLDPIVEALKDNPAALQRVRYEPCRDEVVFRGGVPTIKAPVHAYKDAGRILTEWGVHTFTASDVLILDTLSTFSEAAFNQALAAGGRLNQRPQQADYGWMADSVKLFIENLTSPDLHCHVIVNTHIRYLAGDDEAQTTTKGVPNAKGQEIPRTVARYFNTVLHTRTQGTGAATKRLISTRPQGVVEVKVPSPRAKATYPIETGLADFFRDVLGHGPMDSSPTPIQKESTPPSSDQPA